MHVLACRFGLGAASLPQGVLQDGHNPRQQAGKLGAAESSQAAPQPAGHSMWHPPVVPLPVPLTIPAAAAMPVPAVPPVPAAADAVPVLASVAALPAAVIPPVPAAAVVPPIAARCRGVHPLSLAITMPPLAVGCRLARTVAHAARVGGRLNALPSVVPLGARDGSRLRCSAAAATSILFSRGPLVLVANRQQGTFACT